jgi:hypothetical protein
MKIARSVTTVRAYSRHGGGNTIVAYAVKTSLPFKLVSILNQMPQVKYFVPAVLRTSLKGLDSELKGWFEHVTCVWRSSPKLKKMTTTTVVQSFLLQQLSLHINSVSIH